MSTPITSLPVATTLADVDLLAVYIKSGSTFGVMQMTVANAKLVFGSGTGSSTEIQKGNGTGGLTPAIPETDFVTVAQMTTAISTAVDAAIAALRLSTILSQSTITPVPDGGPYSAVTTVSGIVTSGSA